MTVASASSGSSVSLEVAASPLRIVGVDPELGWGGGETQVLGLTLALLQMGHRADLICDPGGPLLERARAAGVVCHELRIRNAIDVGAGLRLRALLSRTPYDVVHYHTSRAHSLAPFARTRPRVQLMTRRMDYRPNRLFARYLYNHAVDGIAAISRGVADALVSAGVARQSITIIPSGVDIEHFRPPSAEQRAAARVRLEVPANAFVIGTAGALEPRKGHGVLLNALAQTVREPNSAPIVCIIAGEGSCREELLRTAGELGLSEKVRLIGKIGDTRDLLHALDLFAFPSLMEGLGVALLESLACAVPAVASDTGGIPDVVEHETSGLLVPPCNPELLAAALRRLLESPQLRERMGARARARAEQEFSMALMAERTLALYRKLLAAKAESTIHA